MTYVGPGGSTAFGSRWKWPGQPKAPAAPKPPTPITLSPTATPEQAAAWGFPPNPAPAAAAPSAPSPPFMTGQDIVNYGDAFKSHEDQIAQANKDLADIQAQANTALYNIGRNYIHGVDNTQNDAAARGLFQSSIKDGSLADLAASKAQMTGDVNTRLSNAQLYHDEAVKRINDWWANFQEGMNAIKVQNASGAGTPPPPQ